MGDHRVSVRDEASNTNGGGRKMPESNSVYGDGRCRQINKKQINKHNDANVPMRIGCEFRDPTLVINVQDWRYVSLTRFQLFLRSQLASIRGNGKEKNRRIELSTIHFFPPTLTQDKRLTGSEKEGNFVVYVDFRGFVVPAFC
jgi:hypothetical protein